MGADGDGDPPPIPHGASVSEETCFLMIRSTESTNPREERTFPDPNNYSLMTDDMKISTTRFDRLQKTHSSRSGSLMYPAKDCTTMMAASAHSGPRATNLTHPAYLGVCGKLPRQPLQSCASSTFYPIEMYKFYHELQKMHPSRGGSLTEHTTPVKTRARIKQATPTIYNTGSCAVSTIDPACKEGPCGKHSGFAAVCKSNRFQQFAKTTIPRLRILHNSSK